MLHRQSSIVLATQKRPADFEADLYILTTEQGGRQGWISCDYMPNVNFERPDGMQNGSVFYSPEFERLELGTTTRVFVKLMAPEFNEGRLDVGQPFTIKEGARIVGSGHIVSVLNPALRLAV